MRVKLAVTSLLLASCLGIGIGVATATSSSALSWGNYCGSYTLDEPQVSYGSTGDAVKAVQCALNRSVKGANLAEDGIFGKQTRSMVIKFQGCFDLDQDGIVGPKTWRQLDIWSDWDTKADWHC